jgi:uncharacterized membrane protein YphA (DoxX/SURF4 family)
MDSQLLSYTLFGELQLCSLFLCSCFRFVFAFVCFVFLLFFIFLGNAGDKVEAALCSACSNKGASEYMLVAMDILNLTRAHEKSMHGSHK